jgi:putative restriction endonuclease
MSPIESGTHCVYTIVNQEVIRKALENGGYGEFEERSRWATALKVFESLEVGVFYPLLMANAASIIGVQWVANIENIEIIGQTTRVKFAFLIERADPIPLDSLHKASNGEPLAKNYIRPYVPCVIDGELEDAVLNALNEECNGTTNSDLVVIDSKTSEDYLAALLSTEDSITTKQKAMLIAHAQAPGHVLSMRALADVAGYKNHTTANMQYGALGRKLADFFGVTDLPNQTQALATNDGVSDSNGHFAWTLREPLIEALVELGWIGMSSAADFKRQAAAQEVDSDPKSKGINSTVREALIEARIGQGVYRNRLMQVWGGKCALTRCNLKEVLIASHAKPWAECSNEERLDEYNGLLLAAQVDKLFDCGLISFADDGRLLVKDILEISTLSPLGLKVDMCLSHVHPRNIQYLAAHRHKFGFF